MISRKHMARNNRFTTDSLACEAVGLYGHGQLILATAWLLVLIITSQRGNLKLRRFTFVVVRRLHKL